MLFRTRLLDCLQRRKTPRIADGKPVRKRRESENNRARDLVRKAEKGPVKRPEKESKARKDEKSRGRERESWMGMGANANVVFAQFSADCERAKVKERALLFHAIFPDSLVGVKNWRATVSRF